MMKATAADQEYIQRGLADLSPIERRTSIAGGHELLGNMRVVFLQSGHLVAAEERVAALTIEMIVRAECMENGRGPMYRLTRRLALTHQYFRP